MGGWVPVRLAAASTQHDTKQMRNEAQMIMSPGNICEGVECLQEGELLSYKQRRNEEEIPHGFATIIPSHWQGAPRAPARRHVGLRPSSGLEVNTVADTVARSLASRKRFLRPE